MSPLSQTCTAAHGLPVPIHWAWGGRTHGIRKAVVTPVRASARAPPPVGAFVPLCNRVLAHSRHRPAARRGTQRAGARVFCAPWGWAAPAGTLHPQRLRACVEWTLTAA